MELSHRRAMRLCFYCITALANALASILLILPLSVYAITKGSNEIKCSKDWQQWAGSLGLIAFDHK